MVVFFSIDSIFKGDLGDTLGNTIDEEGGVDAPVGELVCFCSCAPPKCGWSVENEDREAMDVCPKRCFCAWILAMMDLITEGRSNWICPLIYLMLMVTYPARP